MLKKITIYTLILAMGLGFFVVQTPVAKAVSYTQIGQFGAPVNSITINGKDAHFASQTIGTSQDGKFLTYLMSLNLDLRESSGSYNWTTAPHIYSIVVSNDGRTIFFSGLFTHVNGQERNGMAAVDLTGRLLDWNPQLDYRAYVNLAIDSTGSYIYAYGEFKDFGSSGNLEDMGRYVFKIRTNDGYVLPWRMQGFEGGLVDNKWIDDLFFGSDDGMYAVLRFPPVSNWSTNDFAVYRIDENNGTRSLIFDGSKRLVEADLGSYVYRWNESIYYKSGNILILALMKGNLYYFAKLNLGTNQFSFIASSALEITPPFLAVAGGKLYVVAKDRKNNNGVVIMLNIDSSGTFEKVADLPDFSFIDSVNISTDDKNLYIAGTLTENYSSSQYGKHRVGDVIKIETANLVASTPTVSTPAVSTPAVLAEAEGLVLTGELAKESGKPAVYLLRNGYKYPILNGQVFEAWGWRWEDVKEYSSLAQYPISSVINYPTVSDLPSGTLVKGSQAVVYVVAKGIKYPIKNEYVFEHLGFEWNKIRNFSDAEINKLSSGAMISELVHPDGLLIKYSGSPPVYLIENGARRVFVSESAFFGHGYTWGQVLEVSPTITYPTGASIAI